jgi:flagellar basal-body rod protein FlgF
MTEFLTATLQGTAPLVLVCSWGASYMIRGLYTAASGMLSQLMHQDMVANNIANINTSGFKRTGASFQAMADMALERFSKGEGSKPVGHLATQSQVYQSTFDWTPGSVQQTGNPLDVALQGNGFMAVTNAQGQTSYTRSGALTLAADGTLSTQDGHTVQGENGPIVLPPNASAIQIDKNGTVSAGNQPVGRIKLVTFANLQAMQPQGNNRYTTTQPEQPPTKLTMVQGALERTNVNMVSEMLHSMTAVRTYETLQKTLQAHSDMLKKAVTEVGRVKG